MSTSPQRDEGEPAARPSVVYFGFDVLDRIEQAVEMVKERLQRAVTALKPADLTAAPDLSQTDWQEGYPIVDFDRLIGMKLTAFRLKDRVHLLAMIDVGLITPATLGQLPAPLRPRLQELLDNPEG